MTDAAPALGMTLADGRVVYVGTPEWDAHRAAASPADAPPEPKDLFHLLDDVVSRASQETIPWVIPDWLYYRGAFLIAGAPKVGKSTMVADLVRARVTGKPWVGLNVAAGPTLLLTEEGPMPTAWRWNRAAGGDHEVAVVFRYEASAEYANALEGIPRHEARDWSFPLWTLVQVREWLRGQRNALVIVDTLASWGLMADENDASEATKVLTYWTKLAQETGACILLVHHMRKSGGQHGEGIRGSTAILGTADGSWEVNRASDTPTDTRRKVSVLSRMAFPTEATMEYDPESGAYTMVDDGPNLGEIEDWLTIAPPDGDGRTMADLASLWEVAKTTAYRRVRHLTDVGRMRREEHRSGSSRTAWRYWSIPPVTAPSRRPPVVLD